MFRAILGGLWALFILVPVGLTAGAFVCAYRARRFLALLLLAAALGTALAAAQGIDISFTNTLR